MALAQNSTSPNSVQVKPGSRFRAALYYGLPMLFCVAVHWLALKTWFYLDDFAWLGLRLELHAPHDLIQILFKPQAQGTVRTLSERLFFLVLTSLFGLEAPPFRIWAFLTQFVNIVLLIRITRRLTGSAVAAFLASLIWVANAGMAIAMGWSSAYNEIAFAFFILLSFYLFLSYIDTGRRKYWIWQWVVFLAGFGALELNVVYPALAAGYALCCARAHVRKTLYLFIPSILFTAAHFILVPAPTDPYYQMYFGFSPFTMLWKYWAWMLGALRDQPVDWRPHWLGLSAAFAITMALAFFAWGKIRRREWLPVFMLAWFLIVILPVLPLKNHFTEYYVFVPSAGIAMLGAWAIAEAQGYARGIAIVLAGLYFTISIADTRSAEKFNYERSRRVKYLVKALEHLPKPWVNKTIFLAGIDDQLYWSAVYPDPFRLIGIQHVYLVPGSEKGIDPHPEMGGLSKFSVSPGLAVLALKSRQAVVLEMQGRSLIDVTDAYRPVLDGQLDGREIDFVDVVDKQYADRLGPGWYPAETGFRWSSKSARVTMARPKKSGQDLRVTGFCPAGAVADGPLEVSIHSGGVTIGTAVLKEPNQAFDLHFQLPAVLIGESTMQIEVDVNRTFQVAGDPRTFGLVFGTFTLQ